MDKKLRVYIIVKVDFLQKFIFIKLVNLQNLQILFTVKLNYWTEEQIIDAINKQENVPNMNW